MFDEYIVERQWERLVENRKDMIDILRGIAVFLMILGHAIQYGSGQLWINSESYFDNYIFKFIYGFHMPFFMLISGYLFVYSLNKNSFWGVFMKKLITLLLPIFMWSVLYNIFIRVIYNGQIIDVTFVKQLIWYIISSFWFLWAVFFCSTVVLVINRFFADNIFIYSIGFVLTFLIPDSYNFHLYKYMYPFFVIGYLLHTNFDKVRTIKLNKQYLLILLLVYMCMVALYEKEIYIYTSAYCVRGSENPIKILCITFFRLFVGLFGSFLCVQIVCANYGKIRGFIHNSLIVFGKNSLGLYIISNYLFELVLVPISKNMSGLNYIVTIIETFVIIVFSLGLIKVIKRNSILKLLLLGGRE